MADDIYGSEDYGKAEELARGALNDLGASKTNSLNGKPMSGFDEIPCSPED